MTPKLPPSDRSSRPNEFPHQPVLIEAVLEAMAPAPGKIFLDATIGYAGHARRLAPLLGSQGLYCGIDRDPAALEFSRMVLQATGTPFDLAHQDFDHLAEVVAGWNLPRLDGVLLDLGVSSPQLDQAERGFSFTHEGPLDMRMNPEEKWRAADLINRIEESDLASLLKRFGEETRARSVARAIVQARQQAPIETTQQLSDVVRKTLRTRRSKGAPRQIHPATKTFQAIRIAVNRELEQLPRAIDQAIECLSPGGRLVVLSYHSLEDRIVKWRFRRAAGLCVCPPGIPQCSCGARKTVTILTRHPQRPSAEETECNPRARSARLRAVEKIDDEAKEA